MNNQEILLAAIKKTDWKYSILWDYDFLKDCSFDIDEFVDTSCYYENRLHINAILFDKEFWQALVGSELIDWDIGHESVMNTNGQKCKINKWKYHIQQIALEDDRIAYLKKFI